MDERERVERVRRALAILGVKGADKVSAGRIQSEKIETGGRPTTQWRLTK